MILANIISDFQGIIEDSNYWNTARATPLANQAMRALAARFGSIAKAHTTLVTVADVNQYAIPVDYIANHLLRFNSGHNQKITIWDDPDDVYARVSDITTSSYPTDAYIWNVENREDIFFYPVPNDAYTLDWFYYREPPELVNNNDEPLIARSLHKYIIDYMELRVKVQDKELGDTTFEILWDKKILEIRAVRSKAAALSNRKHIPTAAGRMPNVGVSGTMIHLANSGGIVW